MSRRYWLSVVAIALIVTPQLGALSQDTDIPQDRLTQSQKNEDSGGHQPENDRAIKAQQRLSVTPPGPPPEEPAQQRGPSDKDGDSGKGFSVTHWWKGWITWPDTFAQWLMAATGVVALVIACLTLELLRRTLLATRHAALYAKTAAEAALSSAESDREANELLRENSAREQRAYVFIRDGHFRLHHAALPDGGSLVDCRMIFRNFGQTPAYDCEVWLAEKIDFVVAETFDNKAVRLSTCVLGPGADVTTRYRFSVTPDDFRSIRDGLKTIFVWGQVKYKDAFRNPQCLEFYRQLGPDTSGQGWTGWAMETHDRGDKAS